MKKRTLALIMTLVLMLSVAIPGTLAVSLDASSTETTFALDTEAAAPIAETPAEEEAEPVEEAPAEEPADVEPAEEEPADVEPVEEAEPEEEVDVKDVTVNEAATQSGEFVVPADNTVVDVNESVDEDDADEDDVTLPECTCPEGYNRTTDYDHDTNCALNLARLPELSNEQMALLWPTLTETERAYILKYAEVNYFTNAQIEYIEKLEETQKKQDYCETITSVTDTAHGVTVSGVPAGVTLAVETVEAENAIVALNITLQRGGEAWQPYEDGDFQKYTDGYVALTLDLSGYELEDGTVVTLNHTHDGETTDYLYVVIDGKITFYTDRFSVYVVSEAGAEPAWNATSVTGTTANPYKIKAGQTVIFYTNIQNSYGEWRVTDTKSAISYTLYDNSTYSNNKWKAPWISVTGVKASDTVVTLEYYSTNGNSSSTSVGNATETFYIKVVAPDVFYIDDQVAENGCLVPAWSEENTSKDGWTYTWIRDDGQAIRSEALTEDGKVNISLDRGGVTNGREPITYTVTASKEGEEDKTASFKVLYGQEILNPGFETPYRTGNSYVYNGYEGFYWKTTAPGKSSGQLTQDIELLTTEDNALQQWFGIDEAAEGKQFVEVNAEATGTLYQDILTTSGADFKWSFSHAARTTPNDSNNTLYIIVGDTEHAQTITDATAINKLVDAAKEAGSIPNAADGGEGLLFTYNDGSYVIWQHTSEGTDSPRWTEISGSCKIPENQYLTRLFFASDPDAKGTNAATCGNFIDAVSAGETMSYKIEYYPNGSHETNKDETGNGSVYTMVQLKNLQSYLDQGYVITSVKVNNKDYSGDIRNGLYITDYGTVEDQTENILVKITLRKKAITVTKKVTIDGWDTLTGEQRKALVSNYQAEFELYNSDNTKVATTTVTVSSVASDGTVSVMGEFVPSDGVQNGNYTVKETEAGEIEGYKLASTTYTGGTTVDGGGVSVTISDENPTAAVTVTNHYEQLVKISYVAVGPTGTTNFGSVSPESETVKVKSGTAQGSTPTAGDGFKFVGWYKDEACTQSVDSSWVTDNKIVPQKDTNGKNVAATYYAKFEYDVTSLTIKKELNGNAYDENDVFVFTVTGEGVNQKVTIKGAGSVTINGLKVGSTYTVTEDTTWSWRYTASNATQSKQLSATASENTLTFTNTVDKNNWLDGNAYAKNVFN